MIQELSMDGVLKKKSGSRDEGYLNALTEVGNYLNTLAKIRGYLIDIADRVAPELAEEWLGPCVADPFSIEGLAKDLRNVIVDSQGITGQ